MPDFVNQETGEVQQQPESRNIVIEGNLGKDVEFTRGVSADGREYSHARLFLIEELSMRNSAGEYENFTRSHNVDVWGKMAENVAGCVQGERLLVSGREKTVNWTDKKTGEPRTGKSITASAVGASYRMNKIDIIPRAGSAVAERRAAQSQQAEAEAGASEAKKAGRSRSTTSKTQAPPASQVQPGAGPSAGPAQAGPAGPA